MAAWTSHDAPASRAMLQGSATPCRSGEGHRRRAAGPSSLSFLPPRRCTTEVTTDRPLFFHARRPRVAVIGGGISGLATAYFLSRDTQGHSPRVSVIEAAGRLGGKVFTRQVGELAVDTGPDSLPVRPVLMSLLAELGLADAIVPVAAKGAYVWSHGKLRRLPPGTATGVPDRLVPLLRSRLLSPWGILRAGLDLVLPRRSLPADASIADVLRPRFGPQLFERLVEPLLGGMYAGRADLLSARSTVPDLEALARANRSVYLALRRRRRDARTTGAAGHTAPSLVTLDGGLGRLIAALTDALTDADLRVSTPVTALQPAPDGFRLDLGEGSIRTILDADAVVFATPAFATADLIESLAPAAAAVLRDIPYLDVATITLTYRARDVGHLLDATGFLVPPVEGRLLVGCSWLSAKWPHLAPASVVVLRAIVGRPGDRSWAALDDDTLIRRVRGELADAMGLTAAPRHTHLQRWPRALPQYTVGHCGRLDRLDAALGRVPGLHVTGAAYRGAGVVGCIAQAQECAAKVLAGLAASEPARVALS